MLACFVSSPAAARLAFGGMNEGDPVPEYLSVAFYAALAPFAASQTEASEADAISGVATVTACFAEWSEDGGFWDSSELGSTHVPLSDDEMGSVLDQEQAILAKVVDPVNATFIAASLPLGPPAHDAAMARVVVTSMAAAGANIQETPTGPARKWRAFKFLRDALTVVSGGLAIAADIVTPDPTGITKVASIVGGVAAITSVVD
jgi:hypothetical protein